MGSCDDSMVHRWRISAMIHQRRQRRKHKNNPSSVHQRRSLYCIEHAPSIYVWHKTSTTTQNTLVGHRMPSLIAPFQVHPSMHPIALWCSEESINQSMNRSLPANHGLANTSFRQNQCTELENQAISRSPGDNIHRGRFLSLPSAPKGTKGAV